MEPRLIVGISGASGAPLALAFLRGLRAAGVGAELIVSRGGALTLRQECGLEPQDLPYTPTPSMITTTSPRHRLPGAIPRWAWQSYPAA